MKNEIKCCGLVDESGMDCLVYSPTAGEKDAIVTTNNLYKKSLNSDTPVCYFEVYFTQSQVDIFTQLEAVNDYKGAAKALVQFAGENVTVPDSQIDIWNKLSKTFKTKK